MRHIKPMREGYDYDYDPPDPVLDVRVPEGQKVFKLIGISDFFHIDRKYDYEDRTTTLKLPKYDLSLGGFALFYKTPSPRDLWICDLEWGGYELEDAIKDNGYWEYTPHDDNDEWVEDWDDNVDGFEGFLTDVWNGKLSIEVPKEEFFGKEKDYHIGVDPVVPDAPAIEQPEMTKPCCKIESKVFADVIHDVLLHSLLEKRKSPGRFKVKNIDEVKRMLDALAKAFPG
jgi:hypothetical protein